MDSTPLKPTKINHSGNDSNACIRIPSSKAIEAWIIVADLLLDDALNRMNKDHGNGQASL